MGDTTGIQWTDHTFSPWWGCARVSPACRFCYADEWASRWGFEVWRRKGPRRMLSDAVWRKPLKWNRDAEAAGIPAKVFCASMADVFEDHPDVGHARERLWGLIEATPWLRWQLLTKRPENVNRMVPWGDDWPSWVWLGTSVENQPYAERRIPLLYQTGAKTLFLSCEPLLGPVDLSPWTTWADGSLRHAEPEAGITGIAWCIIGGESGAKARPTERAWIESLLAQCREAEIAPFVKQLGKVLGARYGAGPKGADMSRWPEALRVREFPADVAAVPA